MKNSFKKELQKEIATRFTILAFVVSLLLVVFFLSYTFYVQDYQLKADNQVITEEFQKVSQNGKATLLKMNQKLIPEFIQNKRNEREVYSAYYQASSAGGFRGDFLLTSTTGEITFSTNPVWNTNFFAQNYLKMVITSNNKPQEIEKITMDSKKNHYLVLLQKIESAGKFLGYSVLLLNGNDFVPSKILYDTQFVIADNFDNTFAKNGTNFIEGNLEKVKATTLEKRIFQEDKNLYLTKQTYLANNIVLYTYKIFLPLTIFVAFTLVSVIMLTLFLILVSLGLAKKIATHNTQSIDLLVAETEKISEGTQKFLSVNTQDEFAYLADNINQMLQELQTLHQQTLELEKQSLGFERKMLEAQFNPHFLYNTLETIRVTSQFDVSISQKLIASLTRVLRYSLNHMEEDATVLEDSKILKDFLEVTAIRFEKFSYELWIEEKLESLPVPRLFLLPIVENALKYGMREREDLKVEIRVYQENKEIIFEVMDNGQGFSKEKIAEIYQQGDKASTQHGLVNSLKRLKMAYPYSDLRIDSQPGTSKVQLVIWEVSNV